MRFRPSTCLLVILLAGCGRGVEPPADGNDHEVEGSDTDGGGGDGNSDGDGGGSDGDDGGDHGGGELPRRLTLTGTQIIDPDGHPIVPRGFNWGRWDMALPQDGTDNATQGATVVRVPLRWWGAWGDSGPPETRVDSRDDDAPGHIEAHHLTELDATIDNATNAGLWVVLFVDSNCGQASPTADTVADCGAIEGQPRNFRNSPADKQAFAEVWSFLVTRYASHERIGMYEILPEPNFTCDENNTCTDGAAQVAFYRDMIPVLRAIDARTPILVGPNGGYNLDFLSKSYIEGVSNLVYTGNFLNGPAGKPEKVQLLADFSATHGVPVFVQQVGSRKDNPEPEQRARTILTTLNAARIGWTWWTYREVSPDGFAPYWVTSDDVWHVDAPWLTMLSEELRADP